MRNYSHRPVLAAALATMALGAAADAQPITYRVASYSGQPAPAPVAGDTLGPLGASGIDHAGRGSFIAILNGPVLSGQYSLWSETPGGLSFLAANGAQAPGTAPGINFASGSGFPAYVTTGGGHTGFMALLSGPGVTSTNNLGLWWTGSGAVDLLARSDSAAPGAGSGVNFARSVPGVTYGFSVPAINRSGSATFTAYLTGSGVSATNNTGIWRQTSGPLSLAVREGSPAPGTPSGVNFGELVSNSTLPPSMNDNGKIAFRASLAGPGITQFNNDTGIWTDAPGALTLVARAGSPAPGTTANFASTFTDHPVMNNAGSVAFVNLLTGSGVTSSTNVGVWSGGAGSLSLVARSGQPAPGAGAGVNFSAFPRGVVLNDAGKTAFLGLMTGSGVSTTNDMGIWSNVSGALSLIAREGSPAPGTDPGIVFVEDFSSLTMNGAGQIAFICRIVGPGTGSGFNNGQGIWATDRAGVLRLVVRAGQLFEVRPGVFDTISDFGLGILGGSGGEDGLAMSFNDLGQLVFRASFDHMGSGIYVANVPEPACVILFTASSLLIMRRRSPGLLN